MANPGHAAALKVLEDLHQTDDMDAHMRSLSRAHDALDRLAALYRAGVELQNAGSEIEGDQAYIAFDAALAAVADALTKGKGK